MAGFCKPSSLFPDINPNKTKVMEDLFFILKHYLKTFLMYQQSSDVLQKHPAWPGRRQPAPVIDSLFHMNELQFTLQGQGYSLLMMTNVQMQHLDHSSLSSYPHILVLESIIVKAAGQGKGFLNASFLGSRNLR